MTSPTLLGRALRAIGRRGFKGKGRLVHYWLERRDPHYVGVRTLPGGGRITCDFAVPYEAMVWARQEEETDLSALRALLSPGDHFVDCGANVGLWSLTAAACVGATGRVTAFEPNPAAYRQLTRNIAESPAVSRQITAVAVAVAEKAGEAFFDLAAQHNLGHMVDTPGPETIRVATVSLDEYLAGEPIRMLKIDIEGAEAAALRGAGTILAEQRPWVLVEFNALIAGRSRIGDWEVFGHLEQVGYRCRRVVAETGCVPGDAIHADTRVDGYVNVLFEPPAK